MHGNVIEWIYDWYSNYDTGFDIDPVGPSAGTRKIIRSFNAINAGKILRSANRNSFTPNSRETPQTPT